MKIIFYILLLIGVIGFFLASYREMTAWKYYDTQKFELEIKKSILPSLWLAYIFKYISLLFVFTASSRMVINQKIHFIEMMMHVFALFLIVYKEDKFDKFYGYLVPDLYLSRIISSYALGVTYGIFVWPLCNLGFSRGSSLYFQNIMNLAGKIFNANIVQNNLILVCAYFTCFISLVFVIAIISEGLRRVFKIERSIPWGASRKYIRYWHAVRPGKVLFYDDFKKLSNKIFLKYRRHARVSKFLNAFGGKVILGERVYLRHAFTPMNIVISLFVSSIGLWGWIPAESKRHLKSILFFLLDKMKLLSIGDWGSLASMLTAVILIVGIVLAYVNKPSITLGVRNSRFSQAAEALVKIELKYSEIYRKHAEIYLDSLVRNTYKSYDLLESDIIPDYYRSIGFNFYQDMTIRSRQMMITVFDNYDNIYESVASLDKIYADTQNKSSLWGVRRFFIEKNLNFGLIEYGRILGGYTSYGKLFPNVRFSEEKRKIFSKNIQMGETESYYFKKYRDFIEGCEQGALEAHIVLLEIREALWVIGKSIDESRMEKILKSVKG